MTDTKDRLSQLTLEQRASLEQRLLSRLVPAPAAASSEPGAQPLSFAQESVWFFDQLVPNSPLYNIPQAFRLRGRLSHPALERAFQGLLQRHSALRTKFEAVGGAPRQTVQEKPFNLPLIDLSKASVSERAQALERLLDEEAKRPFRLSEDLMLRALLITLAADEHVLAITVHHIVSDFASLEILHEELAELYQAELAARAPNLPPVGEPFGHWAARQRTLAESPSARASLTYWTERLQDARRLQLPTDHPRTETRTFRGSRRPVRISRALTAALKQAAEREDVTLYMLLLAGFQTLLARYSGQDDITVGSPFANRGDPAARRIIGYLLNTTLLRVPFGDDPSFRELLRRVRGIVLGAIERQEIPLEKLVQELRLPREPGANPLCQVMFQYLPAPWPQPRLPGIAAEPLPLETGTAKFELTLTLMESAEGLVGDIEFNADLFDAATIDRMMANYGVLLESAVHNAEERVSRLALLSPEEREQVVHGWNQTARPYPREARIPDLFEEQARERPDAVALLLGEQCLTYSELNRRANQLARFLTRQGVRPGGQAGLCVERSFEMIVGLLAILKAGAAYVPLDPKYPPERIDYMLQDSGVSLMVTTTALAPRCQSGAKLVFLDQVGSTVAQESAEDMPKTIGSEDLAYIMYTSGSTGQPKGVAVPHRAVLRLVKGADYAGFAPEETFLQFAPLCFDASTFEIWGPLLNGGRLALYPPEFESLEQFARVLRHHQVTTLWLTAGLFQQMVDEHLPALSGLRQLLAGGDVLSVPHVLKALKELPQCQLINGYGPTENTTFTCCHRFPRQWPGLGSAPIGRPISNTQVYLLDAQMSPVPIGAVGELYIGGDGLARGYWNSPDLTSRKFLSNPFSAEPKARLYKTGDRARHLSDGTIEFLGRLDDQVKLNGFRVHLSEVESALQQFPGVRQVAVVVHTNPAGAKELIAYVAPEAGTSAADLRRLGAERLPAFMRPAHFVLLDNLPLTPNGKVDRRALPALAAPTAEAAPQEPAEITPLERRILRIWKDVFGREDIGVNDNFFDLGGHSLLATRLISRMNQTLQSHVSLATLFHAGAVRALASKMDEAPRGAPSESIKRRARPG